MTTYVLRKGDMDRELVRANLHSFIDRLPDTQSFEIDVHRYTKPRSDKQRKSLFGVAYKAIMAQCGLQGEREKERLHLDFCGGYFGWRDGGIGTRRPIRTTTINEMGERQEIDTLTALDMYAFIQRTCAEYGVDVPDPDPFWREKAASERAAA